MRLVYEPILPKEYTRLEYLEAFSSTAVAYISIPYTPNTNTNFETKVRYNASTTSSTWAMGATTWWGVHLYLGTQIGITNSSATTSRAYANYTYGTDVVLKLDGNSVYVNGELAGTITKTNATSTLDIFRYYNGSNLWWNGRIYYLKIDDGTTKINLIPALRNSDLEPGMYDTESGTFYTNAGAGTFNYEIIENADTVDNPKYQQVEYLEATGTQYILSGFTPTLNTDYEVTLSSTSTGQNRWVMGSPTWVGIHYKGATNEVGVTCSSTAQFQQYISYAHDDSKLTMALKGDTVYANGVSLGTLIKKAGTLEFALFGYRDPNQGATLNYVGKIYKCLIKDDGIPVRNLIPVIRKADDKPGMYDKVTGQFFTNSNTTGDDFLYGNKINQSLPKMYEKLEYLESTGTQYIDTGVIGKTGIKVSVAFMWLDGNIGNDKYILGSSNYSSNRIYFGTYKSKWMYGYGDYYQASGIQENVFYDAEVSWLRDNQYVKVNGTNIITKTSSLDVTNNTTMYLFSRHENNSTVNWIPNAKIYYCKIWDNDVLVRNYVPALRKSDNKPGMYDFVSGQFFTNLGTGEFTYDYPVKPLSNSKLRLVKTGGYTIYDDLYKEVEYLQSTGTQYIDTGITGSNKIRMEVICQGSQTDRAIAGCGETNDRLQIYAGATYYSVRIDGAATTSTTSSLNKAQIILDAVNKKATVNGINYSLPYTGSISSRNIHLFRVNRATLPPSDTTTNFIGKIWQFKLYDNGILVRDFIPVIRIGDSKPGMYDKVNRVFYTNAGTGEFIYPTPTLTKPLVTRLIAGGYV